MVTPTREPSVTPRNEAAERLRQNLALIAPHAERGLARLDLVDALRTERLRGGEERLEYLHRALEPVADQLDTRFGVDAGDMLRLAWRDAVASVLVDAVAGLTGEPDDGLIDSPYRCQCGHTRPEHESRYNAPNHCTHRCLPPWVAGLTGEEPSE